MKTRLLALSLTLLATLGCITACTKEEPLAVQNNSVRYEYTPSATVTTPSPSVTLPADENASQEVTQEPTAEEQTVPAPHAPQEYKNEYTANGDPVIVYEVLGYGDNAVYSGNYERFVYRNLRNGQKMQTEIS